MRSRAAILHDVGGPWSVEEFELDAPKAGEVLVPGDHVVMSFVAVCGQCRWCASGMEYICDEGAGTLTPGMPTDGTFRHHTSDGANLGHLSKIGAFSEHTVVSQN